MSSHASFFRRQCFWRFCRHPRQRRPRPAPDKPVDFTPETLPNGLRVIYAPLHQSLSSMSASCTTSAAAMNGPTARASPTCLST